MLVIPYSRTANQALCSDGQTLKEKEQNEEHLQSRQEMLFVYSNNYCLLSHLLWAKNCVNIFIFIISSSCPPVKGVLSLSYRLVYRGLQVEVDGTQLLVLEPGFRLRAL